MIRSAINSTLFTAAVLAVGLGGFDVTVSATRYDVLLQQAVWAAAVGGVLLAAVFWRGGLLWRAVVLLPLLLDVAVAAEAIRRGGRIW